MKSVGLFIAMAILIIVDFIVISYCSKSPAQQLMPYFQNEVKVIGYIEPLSVKHNGGGISFVVTCEEFYAGLNKFNYNEKLRIYIGEKASNTGVANKTKKLTSAHSMNMPKAGKVELIGKLQELRSFANPGNISMEKYNWVHGLGGMISRAQMQVISEEPRWLDYFALLNLELRGIAERNAGDKAAILNGMVLGESKGLSTEARESFNANGISHLLSVSGTHLILLVSFLRLLLSSLGRSKSNYIILIFLIGYACLCGLKPPVLRALSMSAVLMWGDEKTANRNRIFCVLVMSFLLYKPVWILDLGFQLSFGAAAGLLWLLPTLKQKLKDYLDFAPWLVEGVAVTLTVQLATLPIIIGNFYTISLISILSNILLVPILELSTILTIIGMIINYLCEPMSCIIIKAAAWLIEQVMLQATWLKMVPLGLIVIGKLPIFCAFIYYVLLLVWLDLPIVLLLTKLQRKFCIVGCCFFILGCYLWRNWLPVPTTIYFLDVGQGDAAVVVSPQHKVAIIDTGGLSNFDTGAQILTPFLHSLGKSSAEVFIPSHGDKDHIGGSPGLARNIKIGTIILPNELIDEETVQLYDNLLQYAQDSQIRFAKNDVEFDLGGAKLKLIEIPEKKIKGNDASTLVELKDIVTGYRTLFTGDMSRKREINLHNLKQYDVFKVGHHGSKSSTSEFFIEKISPRLAIISCGYKNMYGHPHKSVLERLDKSGIAIARTDLQGCIKVEFTSEGIKWQGYREN